MNKSIRFRFSLLSLKAFTPQIFLVLVLACAFTTSLVAQAPNPKISIQGTLKTATGASVADGTYDVTFKLYPEASGSMAAVWEEMATVEVIGGIYSHYLGSVVPLDANDFVTTLWLGVKVGSYELVPRSELAYSPYAFSVYSAQTVACSGALGDVKYSILNPTQFSAVNGACWVPMDGRALAATDKLRILVPSMTTVPDGGGLFLRSQEFSTSPNYDPTRSSGSAIATLQSDEVGPHSHTMQSAGIHSHNMGTRGFSTDGANGADGSFDDSSISTQSAGAHTHTIDNSTGSESRPKNLNFWIYIRIN